MHVCPVALRVLTDPCTPPGMRGPRRSRAPSPTPAPKPSGPQCPVSPVEVHVACSAAPAYAPPWPLALSPARVYAGRWLSSLGLRAPFRRLPPVVVSSHEASQQPPSCWLDAHTAGVPPEPVPATPRRPRPLPTEVHAPLHPLETPEARNLFLSLGLTPASGAGALPGWGGGCRRTSAATLGPWPVTCGL